MTKVSIIYNGTQTEVNYTGGLRLADFKKHNNLEATDLHEIAKIQYKSAEAAYANNAMDELKDIPFVKANKRVIRKGGEFVTVTTGVKHSPTDKIKDAQLVKDWAAKSSADNLKKQEAAKSFLYKQELQPITSNTSIRREEVVVK